VTDSEKLQAAVQLALAAGLVIGILVGYGWARQVNRATRRGR
jgi:uncharacterized membrane-anchored protein YhcB (DUF1043 family)